MTSAIITHPTCVWGCCQPPRLCGQAHRGKTCATMDSTQYMEMAINGIALCNYCTPLHVNLCFKESCFAYKSRLWSGMPIILMGASWFCAYSISFSVHVCLFVYVCMCSHVCVCVCKFVSTHRYIEDHITTSRVALRWHLLFYYYYYFWFRGNFYH